MADEGEQSEPVKTRAELMLQHLLERQLATSGRLEQVAFSTASTDLYRGIHGAGGVSTLAEFRVKKEQPCPGPRTDSNEGKRKRKRYGPDPVFLRRELESDRRALEAEKMADVNECHRELGRHEKELELSLVKGKGRLQAIAHLAVEDVSLRKPLAELSEVYKGTTPEDRARFTAEKEAARSALEVFSAPAPAVLDLNTYLEVKAMNLEAETSGRNEMPYQVPEEAILANRLSLTELREWSNGKFRAYNQGAPTNTLYIKNLSPDVTEADLVSIFVRYQKKDQCISFRLMQKGRMKGQAFVTFSDTGTAAEALTLVNGYVLKGRPMLIEYARGSSTKPCARQ